MCLARRSGAIKAVDIYFHLSGERLSETMQRLLLAAAPTEDLSMMGRIRGRDREILTNVKVLNEMTQAVRAGNSARALELYRTLPETLQHTKPVLLIRLIAAQGTNEEEYLASIDAYRAAFPGDPSLHLVSIDALTVRKQFAEAHAALTGLDEAVGGDPYLHSVRGNLYVMEGKYEQAETIVQLLLENDPRDLDAHWLQISIAVGLKDHSRTAELLTKVRDELGVTLVDLRELPDYSEFVKSAAYEEWLKIPARPTTDSAP